MIQHPRTLCQFVVGKTVNTSSTAPEASSSLPTDIDSTPRTTLSSAALKCEVCHRRFKSAAHYRNHMKLHAPCPLYHCQYCKKTFSIPSRLKSHLVMHTGEKRYHCAICEARFSRAGDLRRHVRIHDGKKSQNNDPKRYASLTGDRGKGFNCPTCHKCFVSAKGLAQHCTKHNRNIIHQCQICEKSFSRLADLTSHIRVHTGEKPYQCQICGERFSFANGLSRHSYSHQKGAASTSVSSG